MKQIQYRQISVDLNNVNECTFLSTVKRIDQHFTKTDSNRRKNGFGTFKSYHEKILFT